MDKNKFLIPGAIIIGFFIVGLLSSFGNKTNKQNTVLQPVINATTTDSQAPKEASDKFYDEHIKCQSLLKDLKKKWYNVLAIYYEPGIDTCMVVYTRKGVLEQSAFADMHDIKE